MINGQYGEIQKHSVYWDQGDSLVVQTKFRGKNAFGGMVLTRVKAKVSLAGDVLEIIEQE